MLLSSNTGSRSTQGMWERSNGERKEKLIKRTCRTEGFLLIVLGCVPIIKRPWDHFIQHASNSPLITSLRRLVSQSAIGHQTDNTIQNRKYTRHDDSAYPLQNRLKANGSIGSAANEGFLYPESAEQPVRQENGISGQKVESVFQVV